DPERSQTAEDGKKKAQPFCMKPSLQSIHGPAQHTSVSCLYTIFHRDQSLAVLCGNSKYAGKPAPEYRAGSSKSNGRSHTDDVSCTNGCRQSCGKSAELAYLSFRIRVFRHRKLNPFKDLSLDAFCPDSHKNMGA